MHLRSPHLSLKPEERVLLDTVMASMTSRLRPVCVVAIGSAIFPWSYVAGKSDLDLVLITEFEIDVTNVVRELVAAVHAVQGSFSREPREVVDYQSRRVETKFWHMGIHFDVAVAPARIGVGRSKCEILADNLELYLGNVYIHGVLLAGDRPNIPALGSLHPYLSDEVRGVRMRAVRDAIEEMLKSECCGASLLPYLMRIQFLARRAYPLSVTKHLVLQAEHLLGGGRQAQLTRSVVQAFSGGGLRRPQRNAVVSEFLVGVIDEI